MPRFAAFQLEQFAASVFEAAGAPEDVAQQVAESLVLSNLCGHDSHGVLRIPSYLDTVANGTIDPAARPSVAEETETTAIIDGHWAFGPVTARLVTRVAIQKAGSAHVAAVTAIRCAHIGRLGEFTEAAARDGMVALLLNSGFDNGLMAPYGGIERLLTTNPISFALPAGEGGAVLADFATSAVAEGKLRMARATGAPVPPGAILDKHGQPSTNAADYYDGGVMLPFGGHKGYALSVIIELLGKHLAGAERHQKPGLHFGLLMVAIDVSAFRPVAEFRSLADGKIDELRAAAPAPGFTEVVAPGDPERRASAERSVKGIDLPEETVRELSRVAEHYGLKMPQALG